MLNKVFKYSPMIVMFLLIAIIIGADIKRNNPSVIVDVENNTRYSVEVKRDCIIFNNIKYYLNVKELIDNINKSKKLQPSDSIVSSIMCVDEIYNKYDIIRDNDGKRYIVFYKFRNEEDYSFDCPAFNLTDIEKIIMTRKNLIKDLD